MKKFLTISLAILLLIGGVVSLRSAEYVDGVKVLGGAIISMLYGEQILNSTDDYIEFQGVGGTDNTDLRIDLDGTHPVIDSPTDTSIEFTDPLIFTASAVTVNDTETLPIGYCTNGASGPEVLSTLTSTYKVNVRNFDDATDEDVYCVWEVPADFTGTTITFRVITFITNATGPSTEGAAFFLQGASIADGELLSSAHGTAVKSSFADGTHAQYDRVATTWSAAVTITGIAAGETAVLKLYRDVSDADDDYAQDIGVSMIQLKYARILAGS